MTNYIDDPDNGNTVTLTVSRDAHGTRLDQYLSENLTEHAISRERVKKAIKEGKVFVNSGRCTKPNTKVCTGMQIEMHIDFDTSSLVPEDAPINVLYRDKHLVVLNKQAGLTVHPCPSCPSGTLVHRMLHHFPELASMEGFRPGIVHRLDKDTSGIIVVALTEAVRLALSQAFAQRSMHKEYLALTVGVPERESGTVDTPIGRHPTIKVKMAPVKLEQGGRKAHSDYHVLHADNAGNYALVAVRIHTGRTHQIRVHMSHIGHPLWGDSTYGGGVPDDSPLAVLAARQMLHAWKLEFTHPVSGEAMRFVCPPPDDFMQLATALSSHTQRVVLTGMPGCGKSALLRLLEERGLPVWTADGIVHTLYAKDGDGWHFLRGRYGDRFAPADGPVDRRALFEAMCESASIRKEVEGCVHPIVRHDLLDFWKRHADAPAAAAEIPLFLETGWHGDADLLVGVNCPRDIRAARLAEHRNWSEETLAVMESWQWAEKDKMGACDIVVDNSGTPEALAANADKLLDSLARRRDDRRKALQERLTALFQE
ncbi:dephospho-CoA kinase [Desulfovibrio mangrovi]|uniref:dephospho-CoA kinase n=1 Tax=Desulfovibrio mangrovi TaxID=2976983 RepID=UPI0022463420|nr:dephospho-CoA kinase [Desulfovibrio mangrovi]UZP67488.1 dephospho-CoA kinase [Desulfovibrio mangrovi]